MYETEHVYHKYRVEMKVSHSLDGFSNQDSVQQCMYLNLG
jgi:hypothetical protein